MGLTQWQFIEIVVQFVIICCCCDDGFSLNFGLELFQTSCRRQEVFRSANQCTKHTVTYGKPKGYYHYMNHFIAVVCCMLYVAATENRVSVWRSQVKQPGDGDCNELSWGKKDPNKNIHIEMYFCLERRCIGVNHF